jgi:nucleoid-associated protein YgaU
VSAGETLWGIAESVYGSGECFPAILEANAGLRAALSEQGAGLVEGQVLLLPPALA